MNTEQKPYPIERVLTDADNLARAAEQLLLALNKLAGAEAKAEAAETALNVSAVEQCQSEMADHWMAVRDATHEYRKRANRYRQSVTAITTQQPVQQQAEPVAAQMREALEMMFGSNPSHSVCHHEGADIFGRVKGTWSLAAETACRAAMLAPAPQKDPRQAFAEYHLGKPFTAAPQGDTLSAALADIAAERRRQVEQEGWTPEHDDAHSDGQMATAAACYAISAQNVIRYKRITMPSWWPWDSKWWKPSTTRRDLVKAGALITAEIERLDRAAQKGGA